jgi:hypothetical protein
MRSRPLLAFLFIPILVAATFGQLRVPNVVHSGRGDIPILWSKRIRCSGVDARGCYDAEGRKVWILTGMSLDSTLQTIRHEQCHVSLYEAGIRVDSVTHYDSIYFDQGSPEDYVCDALGWAWLREKRHGH